MISVSKLHYKIGERTLLNNESFELESGKIYALLGLNGSGKSTLLRILCGLLVPTRGEIQVNKKTLSSWSQAERAKKLSYLPEKFHIPFAFSVFELLLLGRYPWHRGNPQPKDFAKTSETLERLNLLPLQRQSIHTLSSGELRLVMLARCVAGDSECLVLDEPLANLDLKVRIHVQNVLQQLADEGRTIVLTLHDVPRDFTGRLLVLREGKLEGIETNLNHEDVVKLLLK